ALDLDIRVLGKHQLFWWPLGSVLRWLGVIAVNRDEASGVTEQAARLILDADRYWFGLAPEGTRKPVPRLKYGCWRRARGAGAPALPASFGNARTVISTGPTLDRGDGRDAGTRRSQRWYAPWRGKNRSVAQEKGDGGN